MNLLIKRDVFSNTFTLGEFFVDEKHFGFTCEDKDRHLETHQEAKVQDQTCIPRGKYKVILSFSHRFQRTMPEVLDVPEFSGVRIHGGNTSADTAGCPLLGTQRLQDGVANCKVVNDRLIELIQNAEDIGKDCWLTVE